MGEPTRVERGALRGTDSQAKGAQGGKSSSSGLKRELKGMDVAKAEARLTPKGPGGGEVGRLRAENAAQQAQIDDLKAENDANRQRSDQFALLAIGGHITAAMGALDDGENALRRVEELVEDMLREDEGKRGADRKVESSVEAYKKAQEPNWVDALSLVLDMVSLMKSAGKLTLLLRDKGGRPGNLGSIGKVAKKGAAEGSKKGLEALGEGFDGTKGVKDVGKGASDYDAKQEKAFSGDEVTAMVGALDGKIDAINGQLGTLATFAVNEALSDVGRATRDSMSHERHAAEMLGVLGGGPRELAKDSDALEKRKRGFEKSATERISALRALLKARGTSGSAQLAKGTRGRSVFDLVSANSGACSVQEEIGIDVELAGNEVKSEREVTQRHWLRCSDPSLRDQVRSHASLLPLYPLEVSPFGVRDDVPLPPEIGLPLARTLPHVRNPPKMVRIRGRNGVRFVPVEQWQAKAERERIVDLLSDFPTPVY